jgi:thiol-disulfide isomerase/thioredoxin
MPPVDKVSIASLIDVEGWKNVCGEVAEKDFLFVVEVFSKWCGPSEAIITTLKRISMDLTNRKIKFVQIEATSEIPDLAKFEKASRPCFLFYKNGEHLDIVEGINAPLIEKFVNDFIPEGVIETDDVGEGDDDDDD